MTTSASLCSGFLGLDQAADAVFGPADLTFVADVSPAAQTFLAHRYPQVPNLGDITAVDWTAVGPVDRITAGYPCQPLSLAGRRAGLDDERWLWDDGVFPAIRDLRPGIVVLENVPGHLSVGFGRVLGDLAAIGYDASWTCVRASDVGAPHRRERVFIVARPADATGFGHGHTRPQGLGRIPAATVASDPRAHGPSLLPTPRTSDTNGAGEHGSGGLDLRTAVTLLPTPTATPYGNNQSASAGAAVRPSLDSLAPLLPTPRASDGVKGGPNQRGSSGDLMLPSAVMTIPQHEGATVADAEARPGEELRDLRNSPNAEALQRQVGGPRSLPAQAELFAELRELTQRSEEGHCALAGSQASGGQLYDLRDHGQAARAPQGPESAEQRAVESDHPLRLLPLAFALARGPRQASCGCAAWGSYAGVMHRWELVLGRPAPEPTEVNAKGGRRLSARAVEFLMGCDEGWICDVPGLTRNQQLHMLGNGVVRQQGAYGIALAAAQLDRELVAA